MLPDGEVSGYLGEELRDGDEIELRGPIGGWFAWGPQDGGPLLLVAGGSGVVPLAAMVRDRAREGSDVRTQLILSARTEADVFYRDELVGLAAAESGARPGAHADARAQPGMDGSPGPRGPRAPRGSRDRGGRPPHAFVCGPTTFVEAVADALVDLGHAPERVRTERFGPSGA